MYQNNWDFLPDTALQSHLHPNVKIRSSLKSSPPKHCNCFPSHTPNLEPETCPSGKEEHVVGEQRSHHVRFAHRNVGKGFSFPYADLHQLWPVPMESWGLYRQQSLSYYWPPANMPSSGLWSASKRRQQKSSSMNGPYVKANPDKGFGNIHMLSS